MHFSTKMKLIQSGNNQYICALFAIALLALLFLFYTPIFETNDDIAMSMIAHGYGIAFAPSAHILFSNVIYGWIISHLPAINGIYPYFYMTFFALFVAAWSLLCFLEILSVKRTYAVAFVLLIFARAVAMPQFTVNAGLLGLSAVTGLLAYQKTHKKLHLLIASLLAFYAFLVRSQELYFVIIVSSPLWINKNLLRREFILFLLGLILVCIVAWRINIYAYSGSDFANYNALAKLRTPFNDFGAGAYFMARPKILASYGYSINDIRLIERFIFADNDLVNPERLSALLVNFKLDNRIHDNYGLALQGIKSIYDPSLRLLLLTSIITMMLGQNKFKFILSWLLFIILTGLLGLIGRPSILRTYYPVMAMLAFLPIIYINFRGKIFFTLMTIILSLVLYTNYLENQQRILMVKYAYNDLLKLNPHEIYYILGAGLPYQYIDLPTHPMPHTYQFYGFGSSYYLPSTISSHNAFNNRSFSHMLKNGRLLKLIMSTDVQGNIDPINQYCKEHFNTNMHITNIQSLNTFDVYTIQCY